jgi:hypothetical protein
LVRDARGWGGCQPAGSLLIWFVNGGQCPVFVNGGRFRDHASGRLGIIRLITGCERAGVGCGSGRGHHRDSHRDRVPHRLVHDDL